MGHDTGGDGVPDGAGDSNPNNGVDNDYFDDDGGSDGSPDYSNNPGSPNEDAGVDLPSFSEFAPPWVTNLKPLTALLSVSVIAGGREIYLYKDPVAYVRAVVSGSIIEAVQMIVGTIASGFLDILFIFTGAFGSAGKSVLGSFGSVGDVLLLLIDTLNNTIATLVASSGPLAPVVVVIIYGGIAVVVAGAVRSILVATGFAP